MLCVAFDEYSCIVLLCGASIDVVGCVLRHDIICVSLSLAGCVCDCGLSWVCLFIFFLFCCQKGSLP